MHTQKYGLAVWLACLHVHAGLTDGHGPRTPVLRPACFAQPHAEPRPNARLAPAEPVRAPRGLARGLDCRGSVHRLRHPKLPRLGMYGPLMEVGYKVRLRKHVRSLAALFSDTRLMV